MKRLLTIVLSLLCFSVMTAHDVSLINSKDVLKQKTEFVKSTQTQMDVIVTSCSSENAKFNFTENRNVFKDVKTKVISYCSWDKIKTDLFDYNIPILVSWKNPINYNKNTITKISTAELNFNNKIMLHNNFVRV
jgi:hypothetical protein